MPVTITFDLEDHRTSPRQEARFGRMTSRFLELLRDLSATATFFVVGELAEEHPSIVREIADAGHEVGLHGWRHQPFGEIGPVELRSQLIRGKSVLEEIIGTPVEGIRAPIFSLTPASRWAVDEIGTAGFTYSSSVLPTASPLHGWPGAPTTPFRWDNDVVELPCPIWGVGAAKVPFLGGVYVRYLPSRVIEAGIARLDHRVAMWSYLHPYDLDRDEPFFVLPWAGWFTSRVLYARRGKTEPRLRAVVRSAGGPGPQLREIARRNTGAPVYSRE